MHFSVKYRSFIFFWSFTATLKGIIILLQIVIYLASVRPKHRIYGSTDLTDRHRSDPSSRNQWQILCLPLLNATNRHLRLIPSLLYSRVTVWYVENKDKTILYHSILAIFTYKHFRNKYSMRLILIAQIKEIPYI